VTTIGTSTAVNGWATIYSFQHKIFYMATRYWVFYTDGTNFGYRTSTDGSSWSDFTALKAEDEGHRFGLHFDGTYIHYVFCDSGSGSDVLYRRGTPQTNGTITWSAVEQTAYATPAGDSVMYPLVTVDSNGYPWVSFSYWANGYPNLPVDGVITKSDTNDGTWSTDASFPYTIYDDASNQPPIPVGVPLTGGKMYWGYCKDTVADNTYGKLYNSGWGDEESISGTNVGGTAFDLVADGDDVYYIGLKTTGTKVLWNKRTYGVGWGSETDTELDTDAYLTIVKCTDGVVLLYEQGDKVYYKTLTGSATEIVDESSDGMASNQGLQGGVNGNEVIIAYTSETGSPYNVDFHSAEVLFGDLVSSSLPNLILLGVI
jgi:hypothetical protein